MTSWKSKKAYITGLLVTVNGATAWTDITATVVKIQDTAGSPLVGATVSKTQLTGNAILGKLSTGVVLGAYISLGTGFTTNKGIDVSAFLGRAAGSFDVVFCDPPYSWPDYDRCVSLCFFVF